MAILTQTPGNVKSAIVTPATCKVLAAALQRAARLMDKRDDTLELFLEAVLLVAPSKSEIAQNPGTDMLALNEAAAWLHDAMVEICNRRNAVVAAIALTGGDTTPYEL